MAAMTTRERRIKAYMNLHGLSRAAAVKKVDVTKPRAASKKKSAAISGRKGLGASAYVSRPSQATEHKSPSKRLKARRKKALSAPAGYFPNPIYRGKYPFRIRQVAGEGRGSVLVTLNNGEKHVVNAKETSGVIPKVGQEFDTIFNDWAKSPKKNPVQKKLTARRKPAGKLNRKVFTVQLMHGNKWVTEGIFQSEESAREYAHALDRKYNNSMTIRVTV